MNSKDEDEFKVRLKIEGQDLTRKSRFRPRVEDWRLKEEPGRRSLFDEDEKEKKREEKNKRGKTNKKMNVNRRKCPENNFRCYVRIDFD